MKTKNIIKMRTYTVFGPEDTKKTFTDMNLAMGYMNKKTPNGEKGEYHLTIREDDDRDEVRSLESELKDMIGTFMAYQDEYAKFMKSCHDIMADMQIRLYNLKKQKNAK